MGSDGSIRFALDFNPGLNREVGIYVFKVEVNTSKSKFRASSSFETTWYVRPLTNMSPRSSKIDKPVLNSVELESCAVESRS